MVRNTRILIPLLALQIWSVHILGQLQGRVMAEDGAPLAFVSIYVQQTTNGTASNAEGDYALKLDPGEHNIVFQYLGYETQIKRVTIGAEPVTLDVVMPEASVILEAVEVLANGEDPAYAIIRQAQKKRSYYLKRVDAFKCRSYVKGSLSTLEVPTRFMGQEINPQEIDPLLDSLGRGMLYLSESESDYYVRRPNDVKEVMISSRVSGDAFGYSFNNAMGFDFSFYENTLEFGRPMVSPIASNAMAFYEYELLGTTYDEEGRLINRIRVIPKRNTDPVFHGEIDIYEDYWSIHSTSLAITGSNVQNALLDTLLIRQTNVHIADDIWMPFQKTAVLRLKIFGFRIGGSFTGVFRRYEIDPEFPEDFFDREIFKVEEESNEKATTYWDSIRPVPLTEMEVVDYTRRDSLEEAEAQDTTEKTIVSDFNLIEGYSRSNPNNNTRFNINNPLFSTQFNTVQGWNMLLDASYTKYFNRKRQKRAIRWTNHLFLDYGFAEKRLRPNAHIELDLNDIHDTRWAVNFGRYIMDYHPSGAIALEANLLYSLYTRQNFLKFYEQDKVGVKYQSRTKVVGLQLLAEVEYGQQRALVNNSDYSFKKAKGEYTSNDPQIPDNDGRAFEDHRFFHQAFSIRYEPGMRYISYPQRRFYTSMGYPILQLRMDYIQLFGLESDVEKEFLHLEARAWDEMDLGVYGSFNWDLAAGLFPIEAPELFLYFKHFDGNKTIFGRPDIYNKSFFMLPYFKYSTNEAYLEMHLAHQFNGLILDRIPLIRKLGLRSVLSGNILATGQQPYFEVAYGIDNIGVKAFRFLRFDVIWQFEEGGYDGMGFVLGGHLPIGTVHRSRIDPQRDSFTFGL